MSNCAIVGINWGDEGKGRMVDLLTSDYDVVVRYQGGGNAGHTVVNDLGKFALHLLPSGIFRQGVVNVLGNGVALDCENLWIEMEDIMSKGVSIIVALLVALAACLVVGMINGVLVGKFKLPPFIATLGTMFCARGVAYMANGNRNTDAISTGLGKEAGDAFQNFFYYGKTMGIYNAFWIAFLIFAVVFFVMAKTRTGRHIYAIGSNVEAAKLSGVNVFATTTKAYLISAFCSFVVGLILAGQAGMGNMEAGNSYEMYGVAAGVIGGISPLGGTGLLLGTFAGAGVWQTLENGLGIIGAPVGIQRIVIGLIVTGAVLFDVVVRQGVGSKKKAK